jgi:ABC-type uncharacterized transport system fused permease/ATPase subunit
MEENIKMIKSLLENTAEYGKTSLKLIKLKALDKTSDVVSSLVPRLVVVIIFGSSLLFLSLGLAFWLGEILGNNSVGFYVIAAFYVMVGIIFQLFLNKWLKKLVSNNFLKQVLK